VKQVIHIRKALPQDKAEDFIKKGLLRKGRDDLVMVVLEDECIIGCGSMEIEGDLGILNSIYVSEKNRNRGIGYGLLRSLMYSAQKIGAEWVEASLEEKCSGFLIKSGFMQADEKPQVLRINIEKAFSSCCCGDKGCGEDC
jgi:N-acetylglutamate synthase-like GNAT family acetyltransferase